MDFSTLFRIKENLNLDKNTLTFLRYIAIFGQFLAINVVWAEGVQKTKAIVSGKWTPKFPIDTKKVIEIVKNARNLDIEIEFEDK